MQDCHHLTHVCPHRLRTKLGGANAAVRGLFGASVQQDEVVAKLEALKQRVAMVRDLFR